MLNDFIIKCLRYLFYLAIIIAAAPILASEISIKFDDIPAPLAPNYNFPASWAVLPEAPGASTAIVSGSSNAFTKNKVDVFYIHPTTLKNKHVWNQDPNDSETNTWTDASAIALQASVFNQCCKIYAPRYRQARFSMSTNPQQKEDSEKAYQLAYSDVLRAFDYYMEQNNNGRPFIIAGHSQGALMSYWLLRDRIDGKPLQKKLITAYVIGIDLMQGDFGRTYQSLTLCSTPEQTACVLAWNSVTKKLDIDKTSQFVGGRYVAAYNTQEGRQSVCINPLTFNIKSPSASASSSKGALPHSPIGGPISPLKAGVVAAHCERGFLIVEADRILGLTPLPGGSLHFYDYALFYGDIQANVELRIKHFLKHSL